MNRLSNLLLLLALLTLTSCIKKAEFKPYVSKEGRFEVATPAPMQYKSQLSQFEDGDVTMHSFAGERDGVVYVINYFDIPQAISDEWRTKTSAYEIPTLQSMLDTNAWIAEARKGDELKISETETARGEHFAATTIGKTQNLYIRILWIDNRFYQVMAGYPPKPSYQQEMDAKKFIWSLKLHSARQH
ncbi:hypothetical protein [Undibacterium sp.]|uniref:hypothetical protein n=1 Tax=Undibacterium sp. TaxID=1914977 RepID=UPI0037536335